MDLALLHSPEYGKDGFQWRMMMASAAVPAVIVCAIVYLGPESPRWYLTQNRHWEAYRAMCYLRKSKIQAARDVFYAYVLLEAEARARNKSENGRGRSRLVQLFTVRRNRNAMIASSILMIMQQ